MMRIAPAEATEEHTVSTVNNMSGPIISGAATVSTTLMFYFQHGLDCRVSPPSISSTPVAT